MFRLPSAPQPKPCAGAGDENQKPVISRREFLRDAAQIMAGAAITVALLRITPAQAAEHAIGMLPGTNYDPEEHLYAYVIDITKCIGCGMCVQACSRENKVPDHFFRTWVERYTVSEQGEVIVDSPNGGKDGFKPITPGFKVAKSYFVPKLCNHCANTPCTQVCPVGASYNTPEGVVLVDPKRCIGCGYCVQACPFGSRFINPVTKTAEKCTWCYHRVTKGMKPACVEACPVGARMFGDLKNERDPIRKIVTEAHLAILQPEKLTKPRCYYLGFDKEIR
ncbi:MAG: 4Fe-4S dicluster domain-containing protein [Deltaproteobacteria bacterium]|nr:4Fe-4S dicluster domain-containing protein [Deltaproteobacteria bacterium]